MIKQLSSNNASTKFTASAESSLCPESTSKQQGRENQDIGSGKSSESLNLPPITGDGVPVAEETPTTSDGLALKQEPTDQEKEKVIIDEDIRTLSDRNIECHQVEWKDFLNSLWSSESKKFDAVLTEPPTAPSRSFQRSARASRQGLDELSKEDLNEFPSFCKRVLVPGGYAIVIIPFYLFQEWYESFYRCGFSVMDYPFVVTKRPDTVPSRPKQNYPQSATNFGLIAQLPGKHPSKFLPPFKTRITHGNSENCSTAAMTNVPQPRSKLLKPKTKIPFNYQELSGIMIAKLIKIFTPPGGCLIDPYAGTMTTGIGAIMSGRVCTLIERNIDCFRAAVQRLRSLLPRSTGPSKSTSELIEFDETIESDLIEARRQPEVQHDSDETEVQVSSGFQAGSLEEASENEKLIDQEDSNCITSKVKVHPVEERNLLKLADTVIGDANGCTERNNCNTTASCSKKPHSTMNPRKRIISAVTPNGKPQKHRRATTAEYLRGCRS